MDAESFFAVQKLWFSIDFPIKILNLAIFNWVMLEGLKGMNKLSVHIFFVKIKFTNVAHMQL